MLGLRSVQGRAILAGVMPVVLLAGVVALAVWRARDMHQQHHALERTSGVATALMLLDDPSLADDYRSTGAPSERAGN
jgi:hypothetical protein